MNTVLVTDPYKAADTVAAILHGKFLRIIDPGSQYDGAVGIRLDDGFVNLLTGAVVWDTYLRAEALTNGTQLTVTVGGNLVNLTPSQILEVRAILTGNSVSHGQFGYGKINAIKRVRELTGAGLKDSKDFVDAL